jgi:hypothetical protein
MIAAAPVEAFGTINGFGQGAQHEVITRAALACAAKLHASDTPGNCFEPATMGQLAGTSPLGLPGHLTTASAWLAAAAGGGGTFGAVGAADVEAFFGDVEHCLGGDFLKLPSGTYGQTQTQANAALIACHDYLRSHFQAALKLADKLVDVRGAMLPAAISIAGGCPFIDATATALAIKAFSGEVKTYAAAHPSLITKAKLAAIDQLLGAMVKGLVLLQAGTTFPPPAGASVKCQVLGHIGRVLHGIQDFYAHGNWTDHADASRPTGIANPPGLHRIDRPPLLDLTQPIATITPGLITSCFTFILDQCANRVDHDADLGKDKGTVTIKAYRTSLPNTLNISSPQTPRGKVDDNFLLAVLGARNESYDDWVDFGRQLESMYGKARGDQMICAVTSDDPATNCPLDAVHVTKAGTGSGGVTDSTLLINCGGTCDGRFAPQLKVTLTAAPDVGSTFAGWSGACVGSAGTCVLTMPTIVPGTQPTTLTAIARFDRPACAPGHPTLYSAARYARDTTYTLVSLCDVKTISKVVLSQGGGNRPITATVDPVDTACAGGCPGACRVFSPDEVDCVGLVAPPNSTTFFRYQDNAREGDLAFIDITYLDGTTTSLTLTVTGTGP